MAGDDFDVLIIGGGVIGTALARELSRYSLRTILVERSIDFCAGASRANTGLVHAGFDPEPGTLKAQLNVEGNRMFDALANELAVPFRRNGALVVAFEDAQLSKLAALKERGIRNGVDGLSILDGRETHRLEPAVNPSACGALFARTAGIVSPYELTFALAENAHANGVRFHRAAAVTDIRVRERMGGSKFKIDTSAGAFGAKVVVNAAGVFADEIAGMLGVRTFTIRPRRGEYMLLDRDCGIALGHTLFGLPTAAGKGVVVTPTTSGNIMLGPNAEDIDSRTDTSTTAAGLSAVFANSSKLVPGLSRRHLISIFAGLRAAANSGDFIIGPTNLDGFINAAGIQSPGLTAAPAIAKLLSDHVRIALGLDALTPNNSFVPFRQHPKPFRECSEGERAQLVRSDRRSGNVICRCEHVTEAEITAAIRCGVGARTLDGIKLRTRAGMGRCQGGYCSDRVMMILACELGLDLQEVRKHEDGSWIVIKRKIIGQK